MLQCKKITGRLSLRKTLAMSPQLTLSSLFAVLTSARALAEEEPGVHVTAQIVHAPDLSG
jgi:hypothetical protein